MILIPELHRDLILPEREQLLAQSIVAFTRPFGREEGDDGRVPAEKLIAIAPDAVDGVTIFDKVRVSIQKEEMEERGRGQLEGSWAGATVLVFGEGSPGTCRREGEQTVCSRTLERLSPFPAPFRA